jgi:hypothetical protein
MGHLVVGPAELEAEDGLLIFALEQYFALEAIAQVHCVNKWNFVADLSDPRVRSDDESQVL